MRCQIIGRYPILTIGFGIVSEYSRSRVPRPPQKITTFMPAPPLPPCRDVVTSRRCPASSHSPVYPFALPLGRRHDHHLRERTTLRRPPLRPKAASSDQRARGRSGR